MTLVLSVVAWMLIGVLAAWLGRTVAADHLGWLWFGVLGVLGAVVGGVVGLAVAEEFYAGIAGGAIGGLTGRCCAAPRPRSGPGRRASPPERLILRPLELRPNGS